MTEKHFAFPTPPTRDFQFYALEQYVSCKRIACKSLRCSHLSTWVLFSAWLRPLAFTVTQEEEYSIMTLRRFDSKNKTTCKPENRQQKDKGPREHPNQILTLLNIKKSEKQSKATINKQIDRWTLRI